MCPSFTRNAFYSATPGDRPYVHRDHWVADLLSVVVFWAVVAAGWAGLVWLFGRKSALAVTVVWLVGWVVYGVGNDLQARVWRRARR